MPEETQKPSGLVEKEPIRISKRDLERLQYNRELMRRANLTGPAVMLMGTDLPMLRQFAQETFMQMSNLYPQEFRNKTVRDWEEAIKSWIQSRRPEFREEILKKVRARYTQGTAVPDVILSQAVEQVRGMDKTSEYHALDQALDLVSKMRSKGA
jgi:hypothetical protein